MLAIDSMPKRAMEASQVAIEIHNSVIEKSQTGNNRGRTV